MGKSANKDQSNKVAEKAAKKATKKQTQKVTKKQAEEEAERRDRLLKTTLELLRIKAANEKKRGLNHFDLLHREWVGAFSNAIKSADLLLRSIEERDVDVHAYQVFEPQKKYTAEEIKNAFKDLNWPKLNSKQPVQNCLKQIHDAMEKELVEIEEHACSGEDKDFSKAMLKFTEHIDAISEIDALTRIHPTLSKELNEISSKVHLAHRPADQDDRNRTYYSHKYFIQWCYTIEEKREGQEIRRYRAYEIFLYAAQKELEQSKLIRSWGELAEHFVPYPPKDTASAFQMARQAVWKSRCQITD